MDLRRVWYARMSGDSALQEILGGPNRIFQRSALDKLGVPEVRPFVVYHGGTDRTAGPSVLRARARNVQVWAHDDPGDYGKIDEALDRIKLLAESMPSSGGLFEGRWVEGSPDLEDPEMKTICRFARLQFTTTGEEPTWS